MSLFDDVINTAKNMADVAGKKTSDFIDVTRMKMQVADMEREISSLFEGLGRLVYDSGKSGEDAAETVSECIAKIDEKQNELDNARAKIDEFRNVVHCPECNTVNQDDALFCKQCGKKLAGTDQ